MWFQVAVYCCGITCCVRVSAAVSSLGVSSCCVAVWSIYSWLMCLQVARDKLVSLGTPIGKLTHSGKFRLTIGALDVLSRYAKHKVRVSSSRRWCAIPVGHVWVLREVWFCDGYRPSVFLSRNSAYAAPQPRCISNRLIPQGPSVPMHSFDVA
eukprot:GHUV01053802.1.p1 GENE.GHUV01053802.1~~GHUV01053802.1.p1  ORF type:complete len:153 (-),score=21.17 GHUV01053802.1:350-808(-)